MTNFKNKTPQLKFKKKMQISVTSRSHSSKETI